MKASSSDGFGHCFPQIRKGRGISQEAVVEAVSVSQRVIAYFEADDAQPPGGRPPASPMGSSCINRPDLGSFAE